MLIVYLYWVMGILGNEQDSCIFLIKKKKHNISRPFLLYKSQNYSWTLRILLYVLSYYIFETSIPS